MDFSLRELSSAAEVGDESAPQPLQEAFALAPVGKRSPSSATAIQVGNTLQTTLAFAWFLMFCGLGFVDGRMRCARRRRARR